MLLRNLVTLRTGITLFPLTPTFLGYKLQNQINIPCTYSTCLTGYAESMDRRVPAERLKATGKEGMGGQSAGGPHVLELLEPGKSFYFAGKQFGRHGGLVHHDEEVARYFLKLVVDE